MTERLPCVYILASRRHGTIYVGVTSDPHGRVYLHRSGAVRGFTKRYGVKRLVYYEMTESMEAAIAREKQLKSWRREWKIALIEKDNPFWEDRAIELGFEPVAPHPSTRNSGRRVHGS
ncbi:MAG TPA: GIY-YIG nuclease family protein [Sphingomicrobium sp.]